MNKVLVTTSWDDGSVEDLKLSNLLEKYRIPATFYIPFKNFEREMMEPKDIISLSRNFEIGGHTENHKPLTDGFGNTQSYAREEIKFGKEKMEDLVGYELTSFCYPKGAFNSDVKQMVGMAGFNYARTVNVFSTKMGDKLLSPTTCKAGQSNLPMFIRRGALTRKLFYDLLVRGKLISSWDGIAISSLNYVLKNGGVFHLWGHSWEIEAQNGWKRLEKVFQYISKNTKENQRMDNSRMIESVSKGKYEYYSSIDPEVIEAVHSLPFFKSEVKYLARLTKSFDKEGIGVLDLGSGTGRFSVLFNKAKYTGVDYSEDDIKFAESKYSSSNVDFEVRDIKIMDFPKSDLTLMWGLLEDETNLLPILNDLTYKLKNGGRIIFSLHNYNNQILRLFRYLRNEVFGIPFPYSSYTASFIRENLGEFASEHNLKMTVTSFGLIPPVLGLLPAFSVSDWGSSLVVILDKKK